jgi:hypothetical protein
MLGGDMSQDEAATPPSVTGPEADGNESAAAETAPGHYWLRVHGYPGDLTAEVVYYGDFCDLKSGRLPSDPRDNLHLGDVIIYYADGPASLYGIARVTGEVGEPVADPRRGQRWMVPIQREAIIRAVNKAPHAVWMRPPSGFHFINAVRDCTYIRLPDEDGPYLVDQVRSRASARD